MAQLINDQKVTFEEGEGEGEGQGDQCVAAPANPAAINGSEEPEEKEVTLGSVMGLEGFDSCWGIDVNLDVYGIGKYHHYGYKKGEKIPIFFRADGVKILNEVTYEVQGVVLPKNVNFIDFKEKINQFPQARFLLKKNPKLAKRIMDPLTELESKAPPLYLEYRLPHIRWAVHFDANYGVCFDFPLPCEHNWEFWLHYRESFRNYLVQAKKYFMDKDFLNCKESLKHVVPVVKQTRDPFVRFEKKRKGRTPAGFYAMLAICEEALENEQKMLAVCTWYLELYDQMVEEQQRNELQCKIVNIGAPSVHNGNSSFDKPNVNGNNGKKRKKIGRQQRVHNNNKAKNKGKNSKGKGKDNKGKHKQKK